MVFIVFGISTSYETHFRNSVPRVCVCRAYVLRNNLVVNSRPVLNSTYTIVGIYSSRLMCFQVLMINDSNVLPWYTPLT